jgi:hypothetical protein
MKKSLVALAALTLVGAASAQVTLTGTLSMSHQKDLTGARGFALSDSSVFLTATEDLGGGMKLVAKTGFDAGGRGRTAAGNTSTYAAEDTSMTLSGRMGALRLANYESDGMILNIESLSGASLATGMYDTAGINTGKANRNGIFYTAPTMSGFTAAVSYVTMAGTYLPSDVIDAQTKITPNIKYAAGPLTVYAEYSIYNASYTNTSDDVANNPAAYAKYDFGVANVGVMWSKPSNTGATYGLGFNVPLGALTVGLASFQFNGPNTAANVGNSQWTELGVGYALSKRTSIKASFGAVNDNFNVYAKNTGAYAANSQSRLGLFHSF